MSEVIVMKIIGKAIDNEEFRKKLFKQPATTLKGYDLTDKELESLSNLNEDNFDGFTGGLGDRTTKGIFGPGT